MCSKRKCAGAAFAAFASGLLFALCFPTKFLIFVLALALILLSVIVCK